MLLPKDYVRLRLCGEHATDVADASGTLLFDVARRRWSDGGARGAGDRPREWLPRALESPRSPATTRRRRAGRGRRGRPGGRRARRRASIAPGPLLGRARARRASCSARSTPTGADPQARVHAFCHAVPERWHAMGVMLSAAGSLQWLRDTLAPGRRVRRAARGGGGLGARRRGPDVPALPGRRAHAARRPGRPRRVRGPVAAPRSRRARARGARGRRLRAARLPRRRCATSARAPEVGRVVRRRRPQRAVAADRRLRARAARWSGSRCEEGAAYGAALLGGVAGGVWRRRRGGRGRLRAARAGGSSRSPRGSSAYARAGGSGSGRCIRRYANPLKQLHFLKLWRSNWRTGPAAAATATSCRRSATRRSSSSSASRRSRACASGPSSSPTTRPARSRTAWRGR